MAMSVKESKERCDEIMEAKLSCQIRRWGRKNIVCTKTGPRLKKFVIKYRTFAILAQIVIESISNLKMAGAIANNHRKCWWWCKDTFAGAMRGRRGRNQRA